MTTTKPIYCEPSGASDGRNAVTVKELAWALADSRGVPKSEHYIYQMRACGFPMERRTFPESNIAYLTATVESAREWIRVNDFRLVDGWGVTGGYQFQLPIKLQADFVTGFKNAIELNHRRIAV